MLIYHPGTMYMNAGRTVHIGGTILLRGVDVAFSRPVCLLLASIVILLLLRFEGWVAPARALLLSRVAAVAVVLWWLLLAKGYGSLSNAVNLVFIAGCALLLVVLFAPGSRTIRAF